MKGKEVKEKIKQKVNECIKFILNPKLLLCFLLAWIVTNGWSYIFLIIGTYFKIAWMIKIATVYLAFLWLPITPEKIITVALAIFLLQLFFPGDQETLAILKTLYAQAKGKIKKLRKT